MSGDFDLDLALARCGVQPVRQAHGFLEVRAGKEALLKQRTKTTVSRFFARHNSNMTRGPTEPNGTHDKVADLLFDRSFWLLDKEIGQQTHGRD